MSPDKNEQQLMTKEEQKVLKSVRMNRVILPILIGVAVVFYMMWKQLDWASLVRVWENWTSGASFWVLAAIFVVSLRHFAYMTRLRILTDGEFTWKKCFELIFIWEFSSAVTPTSVGGSAVAMFVLSQEELPAGKIATIIFYTIVFDTFFFIIGLPILYILLGDTIVFPTDADSFGMWQNAFFAAYILMITYGSLFFYGIIINPSKVKGVLLWLCSNRLLGRFKEKAAKLADDMVLTSDEIKGKPWTYHAGGFGSTAMAWSLRFVTVMCLMLAFIPELRQQFSLWQQSLLYGRLEVMYVVLAISPTPGGAGFAEAAFGPFLTDFIPKEAKIAIVIATLWRVLTYYSYLLAGAVVIPNWISNLLKKRGKVSEKVKES